MYVVYRMCLFFSGLLVGYLTLKKINKKGGMGIVDILLYYLHRYIRYDYYM